MIAVLLTLAALAADLPDEVAWQEVAEAAGMDTAQVRALAAPAKKQDSVLKRMATPWEAKPWHAYHPIFLTDERLRKGVAYWEAHAETLQAAEAAYGVPAEVIVAILGVETRYGEVMGDDRVLDALYTLGFHHERRGAYFRKELGHFLRLSTDEGWSPEQPKGSYAGAMGTGQFMPSSYRTWAVDGDGDGTRDLFASQPDAIHSVANYLKRHGWQADQPVLLPATVTAERAAPFLARELKPTHTWRELSGQVEVPAALEAGAAVRLYDFDTADGPEYRVGLQNFYAITRYNHSKLYARVVFELAEQLRTARKPR